MRGVAAAGRCLTAADGLPMRLTAAAGRHLATSATAAGRRHVLTIPSALWLLGARSKNGCRNDAVMARGGDCLLYTSDAADDTPCVDL
eukprot:2039738-Pyramimonas_sp.AAC.1